MPRTPSVPLWSFKCVPAETPYAQIESLLQVSTSFYLSSSCGSTSPKGIEGLRLRYWGTQGCLNAADKQAVIEWLRGEDHQQRWSRTLMKPMTYKIAAELLRHYTKPNYRGKTRHASQRRMKRKSPKKNTRWWSYCRKVASKRNRQWTGSCVVAWRVPFAVETSQ